MGVRGDLFQASVRLAITANFRGEPSSGSAWSEATGTNSPALDLRRNGSRKTMRPLTSGTRPTTAPISKAQAPLRKSRRLGGFGDSNGFVSLNIIKQNLRQICLGSECLWGRGLSSRGGGGHEFREWSRRTTSSSWRAQFRVRR